MIDISNIQKKIIKNIVDHGSYSENSIKYSFSVIDADYMVLHIYNPNGEELSLTGNNTEFFEKVTNMLFTKNKNEKYKGCFNHQRDDDSELYTSDINSILNNFLKIQYTFILIKLSTLKPISLFCLIDNNIYDVCTEYNCRKMGYMNKLLTHVFNLIKNNKLKNGRHNKIKLDIVKINPQFEEIKDYYIKKFNFKVIDPQPDLDIKLVMVKQI
jgi:hypothetical protein